MNNKKRILLAGGTGLVGKKLIHLLQNDYDIVLLTRNIKNAEKVSGIFEYIEWSNRQAIEQTIEKSFAVINLSGVPIVGKKWSEEYKELLLSSRLETTSLLVSAIAKAKKKPTVLINASAVGYYGTNSPENVRTEMLPAGNDFLASLCLMWEQEAEKAKKYGVRVVCIRSGIVLDKKEGALPRLVQPFYFGIGGPIGLNSFYIPWIHINDEARIILFALQNSKVTRPVNAVAPEIITNKILATTIGKILHRPNFFPVPKFVLNFLFGEGAQVITNGVKVSSQKIQEYGFTFSYPTIEKALKNILQ